jgi:primosomal protein N' (replication factor Y)
VISSRCEPAPPQSAAGAAAAHECGCTEAEGPGDAGPCADVLPDVAARRMGRPLTYRIPERLRGVVRVGVCALVPLGRRTARGFVVAVGRCPGAGLPALREILDVPDATPLFSEELLAVAREVADESLSALIDTVRCLAPPEVVRPTRTRRAHTVEVAEQDVVRDQARATAEVDPPVLLWGDMEARRRWIVGAVARMAGSGRQTIVAVPQIAQAPDLVARLEALPGVRVAAFHSDLPPGRRRAVWREIRRGAADVVVGTRSALWAPLPRLGLIIVDDEHDPSYKAGAAPRCHARTVALHRGRIEAVEVVLATQTPSVEAYAAAREGRMRCVRLAAAGPAARVVVADVRREHGAGQRRGGVLSQPLIDAIRRHLRGGGRVVLFVNRVGYARVVVCRECGFAVRCSRCEVPMSYNRDAGRVQCRVCGQTAPAPDVCPRCGGVALWWAGAGTARVEEVARRVFPTLRTARVDRETARAFGRVAAEFASGRLRLVVGTQLVLRARRLRPSLIGVVDADAALYLPDFRAAERALQRLRAVISLAGGPPDPEVVVQTHVPEHPVIAALRTGEDERVYEGELRIRRDLGYPPYVPMACLIASSRDRDAAVALADLAAAAARARGVEVLGLASEASGPRFHVQCVLRSPDAAALRAAARDALAAAASSRAGRLVADMDPQEMP